MPNDYSVRREDGSSKRSECLHRALIGSCPALTLADAAIKLALAVSRDEAKKPPFVLDAACFPTLVPDGDSAVVAVMVRRRYFVGMRSGNSTGTSAPIFLTDSDPAWPECFEREKNRIVEVLRPSLREIKHFGSTAIPHLLAKPIIDMMAPVASLHKAKRLTSILRAGGYELIEADFSERVLLKRYDARSELSYQLHLVVCPSWPVKNELLFRDWLIKHPESVAEYAALKSRLAKTSGGDLQRYTNGKTQFVRSVVSIARIELGLPSETDWSG